MLGSHLDGASGNAFGGSLDLEAGDDFGDGCE